jgi:magnesium chelatase subunit I
MPLDLVLVFSANPEDYTARGKIITPLKDRIGSEISTHYPATLEEGIEITRQEAWLERDGPSVNVPDFIFEAVEQIAFEARKDRRVDMRSGVSQRLPISVLENVISNAERRRIASREETEPRVSDIYSALPAITGKLELEYEGEQQGGDRVARELVKAAVGRVFEAYFSHLDCSPIINWFNEGGSLRVSDTDSTELCLQGFCRIPGLIEVTYESRLSDDSRPALTVSVCELVLEGLYANKKISRSDERGYVAAKAEKRSFEYENFNRSRRIN